MKTSLFPLRAALALAIFVPALVAGACGGGNNNPTPMGGGTSTIVGSSSSSTSSGTGGKGTGGTGTGGAGTGGTGGCVSTTPVTNTDFLNACNGMTCQAFDNKGRLPLLKPDGSLPALP